MPVWVSNWRPEVGNGECTTGLWLYANTAMCRIVLLSFVAGVIVVSINTLGRCQTVGKKVCAINGNTCIRL